MSTEDRIEAIRDEVDRRGAYRASDGVLVHRILPWSDVRFLLDELEAAGLRESALREENANLRFHINGDAQPAECPCCGLTHVKAKPIEETPAQPAKGDCAHPWRGCDDCTCVERLGAGSGGENK